jgi:hypothetical protein
MSAAPGRPKQARATAGLSPAARNLPAQIGTGRRDPASGKGTSSEDTKCRAWGQLL